MQIRQSQATKRSRVDQHAHAQKNNTEQSQEEEKQDKEQYSPLTKTSVLQTRWKEDTRA